MKLRMLIVLLVALLLAALIVFIAPQQLPVLGFKLLMVFAAGVAGFWLDWYLFPYARPGQYLCKPWADGLNVFTFDDANHPVADGYSMVFALAMIRRAFIVGVAMLAVGLGA